MDILSLLKEEVFSHPFFSHNFFHEKEKSLYTQHLPVSFLSFVADYIVNVSKRPVLYIAKDYKFNSIYNTLKSIVETNNIFKAGDDGLKDIVGKRPFLILLKESEMDEKLTFTGLKKSKTIKVNDILDMEKFKENLSKLYERTDLVIEEGEWAARGGIVDLWNYGEELPLRMEWEGDKIISLRLFDPMTQRSMKKIDEFSLYFHHKNSSKKRVEEILPDDAIVISSEPPLSAPEHLSKFIYGVHDGIKVDKIFQPPKFFGRLDLLFNFIATKRVFFSTEDHLIGDKILKAKRDARWLRLPVSEGFGFKDSFVFLTEYEILGRAPKKKVKRRAIPIDDIYGLQKGDYVVHIDYGVGVFEGIDEIKVDEEKKEAGIIKYGDGARVFVPVENIHLIDKYDGPEEIPPFLDTITNSRWQITKKKVKDDILKFAVELIKLYAERKNSKGYAFPEDDESAKVFDLMFPYEETPDQIKVIEEVKKDMESEIPMDRLVCGDVGFGKTEVALRAAFKTISALKQVVIFVPTTLLALQHYRNFKERFRNFPVRIEMLSRLKTQKEIEKIIRDTEEGKVDILIGTNILVKRNLKFKDLGLVIIDEEHKFGVKDKENLKNFKINVDILTLSATPIPRTLYMSLSGLKDISIISTPPPGRRSVITEISEWNGEKIKAYIEREIHRGGQVLFIHNRIENIGSIKEKLQKLIEGVRILVTHGRMRGKYIEKAYIDFMNKKYDILLSTAIVESGLDMGNVNTIIINDTHKFGLSDLYHLRGRVGRREQQAYALLIVPPSFSQKARERVETLINATGPGSGYRIAVRDLEIRGTGEIFGKEQHGHIRRIGFSFYNKILKEVMNKLKGKTVFRNVKIEGYRQFTIPEDYISDSWERVAMYRRIMNMEKTDDFQKIYDEIEDRFGKIPDQMINFLKIGKIRLLAAKNGYEKVRIEKNYFVLRKGNQLIKKSGNIDSIIDFLGRSLQQESD